MDGEQHRGLEAAVVAYTLWGSLTLYWRQLRGLDELELIGWRITMSAVLMVGVVAATRRHGPVIAALRDRRVAVRILLASLLLTLNWTTYVWAIVNDHVLETALGYFLAPLGTMAVGVVVLHEQLTRLKMVAMLLASTAVVMLTVSYGRIPWIALLIAGSWIWYALTKRRVHLEAVESLTSELMVLLLPALALITIGSLRSTGIASQANPTQWFFVLGAGVITAVPLTLFAYAAKRVPFVMLGPIMYIVPIINFLLGWLAFDEDLPSSRVAGFALVWVALMLIAYDAWRDRKPRVIA